MELIQESLPDLGSNKSNLLDIPESKSNVFSKDYKEPSTSPILQNRRILKYINYNDEKYKEKDFNLEQSRETFFRRTNFLIRENSNSTNKRPPSASKKFSSKTSIYFLIQNLKPFRQRIKARSQDHFRRVENVLSQLLKNDEQSISQMQLFYHENFINRASIRVDLIHAYCLHLFAFCFLMVQAKLFHQAFSCLSLLRSLCFSDNTS